MPPHRGASAHLHLLPDSTRPVSTQQGHRHRIPTTSLPRPCLWNPATFSVSHSIGTVNHSAIATPGRQSHHLSIGGCEGLLGPQPQGSASHSPPPHGWLEQHDPDLPPTTSSWRLLKPGDESSTLSIHRRHSPVASHETRAPFLGEFLETTAIIDPEIRSVPVLPLRIDDLNVPVPQPFQVLLDEWPDINVPGPFRVATMGNVGRKGHSPILPAKINSHRGRLDT